MTCVATWWKEGKLIFQKSGKCDLCGHMVERREVFSSHFKVKHAIAGRNIHPPASQKQKIQWFVYLEECLHPHASFQYVGSTNSFTHRWSNTKSIMNSIQTRNSVQPGTGLEKNYKQGCSQYSGPDLNHVRVSLLEHFNTSEEKLKAANYNIGPGCRCSLVALWLKNHGG